VVAAARRQGFVITPRQMFEHRTVARVAAVASLLAVDPAEQGLVLGGVEATPVQRMFLEAGLEGLDHYNLTMLLEVDEPVAASCLAVAVEHLTRHHDMLRARWQRHEGAWRQSIGGLEGPVPFLRVDLADASDAEASAAIEARAEALQASLRLADGPLLRVALFDLGPSRPSRVSLTVHHLACDVASWPILLEDLARVYAQVQRGEAITLPAKTTSFQTWARRLAACAAAPDASDELAFWEEQCRDAGSRLPSRAAAGPPAIADVELERSVLGPRETAALVAAAAERSVTIETLLLTGLALAVTAEAGGEALLVFLERHGRHGLVADCDVSRTVGWFTAVFPCRVPVAASRDPDASLLMIDRRLRAVPHGGVGYGVLRYGATAGTRAALRRLAHPEISFNFLGRVDPPEGTGWRVAREAPGREVGVRGPRPTTLDVTAHIADGRLHVVWAYDRVRYARAFLAALAERMLEIVRGFGDAPTTALARRAVGR
jgi:non-ribosomal peptide synthase protein (TIGR01720 family)